MDAGYDTLNTILLQANRVNELLQHHYDNAFDHMTRTLLTKAQIHSHLGQQSLAMATFLKADELFNAAKQKGVLKAADYVHWNGVLGGIADIYLESNQLETAKQCYPSLLGHPRLTAIDRINALEGLALYHKERKEWVNVSKCCEEALTFLPKAKERITMGSTSTKAVCASFG